MKDTPTSLQLSLSTSLAAYRPGETVTALLRASTPLPDSVELLELELSFSGIERVDTSWVSPSYRNDVAAINADRRRVQRHVVHSQLQAATRGSVSDASLRRYLIRFTLPSWLPPTFRGTAVRYTYVLDATVRYTELHPGVAPLDLAVGPPTPTPRDSGEERGRPGAASTRLAIHVWPASGAGAALPGEHGMGSGDGGARAHGDVFPALQSEDLPLRCWEIGAGTEVQDAVSHIASLGATLPQGVTPPISHGRGSMTHRSQGTSEVSPDDRLPPRVRQAPSLSRDPGAELDGLLDGAAAQAEAGGGGLRSYALRLGSAPLVRVSVHPPLEGGLQPGATLAVTLDFQPPLAAAAAAAANGHENGNGSAAAPDGLRCMQASVLLETEEAVAGQWGPGGKQPAGGSAALRSVHDEHVEVTADTACTHFVLTLPQDATPSFHTPLLTLRWVLRFQFTARVGSARLEQLEWTLPLSVLPPH